MKAILFYRLSQFVYWRADNKAPRHRSPCASFGKNPFGNALGQIEQSTATFETRPPGRPQQLPVPVHSRSEAENLGTWLARAENRRLVTVSDIPGFAPAGRHDRTAAGGRTGRYRHQPGQRPQKRFRIRCAIAAPRPGHRPLKRLCCCPPLIARLTPKPNIRNKLVALSFFFLLHRRRPRFLAGLCPAAASAANPVVQSMASQARLLANNSQAALAFGDAREAERLLASLAVEPGHHGRPHPAARRHNAGRIPPPRTPPALPSRSKARR